MKCPKCGAFVEEGRSVCFMCGENLVNNSGQEAMNAQPNDIINSTLAESLNSSIGGNAVSSSNSYAGFGGASGMPQNPDNGFGTGGFSTGTQPSAPMPQNDFSNLPKPDIDPNAYKNAEVKILKNEEEDVFDFYAKHKGIIKFVLIVLLIAVVGFVGYKIYLSKITPDAKKPLIKDLYFELSSDFDQTSTSAEKISYAKSGTKGTDCFIEIKVGSGSSEDHASEFQQAKVTELTPERDEQGNAKDPLKEFTTQTNEMKIGGHPWYYMNIFYRKSVTTEYTLLKYQLLTAVKSGYYYDITLTNNSSTNACGTALDNFIKSLEFVEKK